MCQYSEELGPDMRDFSGSNKVLPANVIKIDSGEGTDRQDRDGITWSTTSLTDTRRPSWYEVATALLSLEEALSSEVSSLQIAVLQEIKVHLKSCKEFK